jgi:predicted Zn-dependent protease
MGAAWARHAMCESVFMGLIPYRNSACLRTLKLVNQHNETIFPVVVTDFFKDRGFFIFGSLDIWQDFF